MARTMPKFWCDGWKTTNALTLGANNVRKRLAVILAADIVGYSKMMARDEVMGIAAVKDVNDQYLVPLVRRHTGEVLKKMGDGWIVAFASSSSAINFATQIQEELAAHSPHELRIGAHLGEFAEDAEDFYGAGVNLAARLQGEAPTGGVLISNDLFRQLTGKIARKFQSVGKLKFKNIPEPIECYRWQPAKIAHTSRSGLPILVVDQIEFSPDDPDTRSAAAELRDQLLMNLSRRTGIRVVDALTAALPDPTYRLRSRLRTAGDRARLNLSMVLAESGEPFFSQNYEGRLSDAFEFIDEIVARANSDIRNRLTLHDSERLKHLPTENLSAPDLLSRAAGLVKSGKYEDWQAALDLSYKALKIEPDNPMALAMVGHYQIALALARFEKPDQKRAARIKEDVDRAVSLMPQSDYIFVCRALYHLYCAQDFDAAIRDCRQSLSINPTFYIALWVLAQVQLAKGAIEDAIDTLSRAEESAGTSSYEPLLKVTLAFCQYCCGDYAKAVDALNDAIQLRPTFWAMHKFKAILLRKIGDTVGAEASDASADALEKTPSMILFRHILPPGHENLHAELMPSKKL